MGLRCVLTQPSSSINTISNSAKLICALLCIVVGMLFLFFFLMLASIILSGHENIYLSYSYVQTIFIHLYTHCYTAPLITQSYTNSQLTYFYSIYSHTTHKIHVHNSHLLSHFLLSTTVHRQWSCKSVRMDYPFYAKLTTATFNFLSTPLVTLRTHYLFRSQPAKRYINYYNILLVHCPTPLYIKG